MMAHLGQWPGTLEHFLPSEAWDTHREALARELGSADWTSLSSVMQLIPVMRSMAARRLGQPLSADDVAEYEQGAEHTAALYEMLTGEPPPEVPLS